MIVLGIEGALGGFSAAIARDGVIVASDEQAGNVALERGLASIEAVMRDAGVDRHELTRLAVGNGPGGFTGLRITIAYAKSLAQAWNLPLVAVSSFDLQEYGIDRARVLGIVAGRPGIVSVRYRDGSDVRRASGPIASTLAAVLPEPDARPLTVVAGPEGVLAELAEGGYIVESLTPLVRPAAAAAALAATSAHPAASPHEVRADYGEAPAAKVPDLPRRRT